MVSCGLCLSSLLNCQDIFKSKRKVNLGEPKKKGKKVPFGTLLRLRAALSFPPGVRFRSWTSSRSTSWIMALTVKVMSPAWRLLLVCSASSLAITAAVSPAFIWKREREKKSTVNEETNTHYSLKRNVRYPVNIHDLLTGYKGIHDKLGSTSIYPIK